MVASAEGQVICQHFSLLTVGGGHTIGERRSRCVARHPWPGRLFSWRWSPLCGPPLAALALPEDSSCMAS